MPLILRAAAFGLAAFLSGPVAGQMADQTFPSAAVLVLNQDRLLSQTDFGQRIQTELEAASAALAAENRRIEAQLTQEELALTELRPTLPAEEFRPLADEFNTRVDGIRAAQDAKARDLQAQADAAQQRFFEETFPVLLEIVQDRGASVLMDSRAVLLSADAVDITDLAISAINDAIGTGGQEPLIAIPGLDAGGEPEQ